MIALLNTYYYQTRRSHYNNTNSKQNFVSAREKISNIDVIQTTV